jgi:hypothetical protein
MTNGDHIQEEVERTLRAFDNDVPLEPNPFLFSRIQAEPAGRVSDWARGFIWHVRFRHVVMVGILLINLFTVLHYVDWSTKLASRQALVSELERTFSLGVFADEF